VSIAAVAPAAALSSATPQLGAIAAGGSPFGSAQVPIPVRVIFLEIRRTLKISFVPTGCPFVVAECAVTIRVPALEPATAAGGLPLVVRELPISIGVMPIDPSRVSLLALLPTDLTEVVEFGSREFPVSIGVIRVQNIGAAAGRGCGHVISECDPHSE